MISGVERVIQGSGQRFLARDARRQRRRRGIRVDGVCEASGALGPVGWRSRSLGRPRRHEGQQGEPEPGQQPEHPRSVPLRPRPMHHRAPDLAPAVGLSVIRQVSRLGQPEPRPVRHRSRRGRGRAVPVDPVAEDTSRGRRAGRRQGAASRILEVCVATLRLGGDGPGDRVGLDAVDMVEATGMADFWLAWNFLTGMTRRRFLFRRTGNPVGTEARRLPAIRATGFGAPGRDHRLWSHRGSGQGLRRRILETPGNRPPSCAGDLTVAREPYYSGQGPDCQSMLPNRCWRTSRAAGWTDPATGLGPADIPPWNGSRPVQIQIATDLWRRERWAVVNPANASCSNRVSMTAMIPPVWPPVGPAGMAWTVAPPPARSDPAGRGSGGFAGGCGGRIPGRRRSDGRWKR